MKIILYICSINQLKKLFMKKSYLFPNYFKKIGWAVSIPSIIYYILIICFDNLDFKIKMFSIFPSDQVFKESSWFSITDTTFGLTFLPMLLMLSLVFIAFSREKIEDELISKIREKSLIWSVLVFMSLFIFCTLLLYGMLYYYFYIFNIYLLLILMIFKFNFEIYKLKKSLKNEE